jgi:hypothetical protein
VEHRSSADSRIAWWSLIVLGLLILLVGGYLLSHFIRIGPRIAIAYVWSGGLVVVGIGIAAAGIRVLREGRRRARLP